MPVQLPLDLPHRPSLTRDDLIVSASNVLAIAAIDRWPNWHHPVHLIVGPPGSGKSHLAAAWAELAGASAFDPVCAAPQPGFALVIDDIDRSAFSDADIFQVVNAARLGGGSVLATARSRPDEMAPRLADLRSRLKAAATVEIGRPDDVLLEAVLAKLFADRQLGVDARHLAFLVQRMERSLDVARRLVERIDREALATKEKVSRPLIQRVLADFAFTDAFESSTIRGEESDIDQQNAED